MMRTACIRLKVTPEQVARLSALRTAYAEACNRLVPLVQAARCWNRVALHQLGYRPLRQETSLGAQMACNAIFSVCKAYRSQRALGRIPQDTPVPPLSFDRTSVHFDHRTYTLKGETVSLYTLQGRMRVPMILGDHQRKLLTSGLPKEAELVFRVNHETSKAILEEARRIGAATIAMEDLTHIRDRLRAGRRMRARLHRWAFRQLQGFVEYKARAVGISVVYVNPAYSSQTCSACGQLGARLKHRFECSCGLRAHADLNASRNLARIGETAVSPRAVVNTPDVGCVACHASP